jgi:FkbM family methyltransferase
MKAMINLIRMIRMIHGNPISRTHPLAAYNRFIRWQSASRILGLPVVIPWVDQTRLVLSTGAARGNYYLGLMEAADMGFALHLLRSQDLFADIGASVGVYSVLASGVRRCRSVAIEPVPDTMGHLLDNIYLNRIQDLVVAKQLGVSSEPGVLRFTKDSDATNHVAVDSTAQNTIQVGVDTIDNLFCDEAPLLIKIDVEGFESEALAGGKATLVDPDVKAIIIELNGLGKRYGVSDDNIHAELQQSGFHPYEYDVFGRSLTSRIGYGAHNTIYVRDIQFVTQRVENAAPVAVAGLRI